MKKLYDTKNKLEKLINYIKDARKKIKDEEIKENLRKAGWPDDIINEAYKNI